MIKFMDNFTLKNNRWYIQDIDLEEPAHKFGTPLYCYDGNMIVGRHKLLTDSFIWPQLKVFYAMKANYNPFVLNTVRDLGISIDAVSPGEVLLALKLGFGPDRIIFSGNNMTDEEMHKVKEFNILFNIDSLSRFEKFARAFPGSDVCLRFNTDVVAGEHEKMQTGGLRTKFGILQDDRDKVREITENYNIRVVGVHKHAGSGISDTGKLCASIEKLLCIADKYYFPDLEFIDFGGGFKVPYSKDEAVIDYKKFGREVSNMFSAFCKDYGRDLAMYIEPGKFLTSEAGIFIVRVNTLKENRGRVFAGTDSGFTHFIRPALYDAYHYIINISNPLGKKKRYSVCGNICESGDLFAEDRMIPEIREGDYLAILNAGAYCYSMASTYNLRRLPLEIFIKDGGYCSAGKSISDKDLVDSILEGFVRKIL